MITKDYRLIALFLVFYKIYVTLFIVDYVSKYDLTYILQPMGQK